MHLSISKVRQFLSEDEGAVAVSLAVLLAIVVIVGLVASASITVKAAQ